MKSSPSLRIWLLSGCTLSVVVGYVLLLAVNGFLLQRQRVTAHESLVMALVGRFVGSRKLDINIDLAGIEFEVRSNGDEQPPGLKKGAHGDAWIDSITRLDDNELIYVRQNVTESLAYERILQLLLIAAAGMSILLTAALLRIVMRQRLMQPLRSLSDQLNALTADDLGQHLIVSGDQPEELQSIAEAFNALQKRLGESWKRERRFVDGVAHELRTPVTLISGRSQRLLRTDLSQAQQQSVTKILDESSHITTLIQALLELARSDAGRLDLQLKELDAEQVLLEAFERLQPLAPARLQLAPVKADCPPEILADPERLHQCLLALVDNALAYSTAVVQLSCSHQVLNDKTWVMLHVKDSGPGIPVNERADVIERFTRGTTSSGTRGSGIGLAVVVEVARAMGAVLVIADRQGGGADMQLRFQV